MLKACHKYKKKKCTNIFPSKMTRRANFLNIQIFSFSTQVQPRRRSAPYVRVLMVRIYTTDHARVDSFHVRLTAVFRPYTCRVVCFCGTNPSQIISNPVSFSIRISFTAVNKILSVKYVTYIIIQISTHIIRKYRWYKLKGFFFNIRQKSICTSTKCES